VVPTPAPTPLPVTGPDYTSLDIGSATGGSTRELTVGKAYTVAATGTGVGGATDSFRFVYKAITGNFDLRVQLPSLTDVNATTMAGLMARTTLAANSSNAFVYSTPSYAGDQFTYRTTPGAATQFGGFQPDSFPANYLRLERLNNVLVGYRSVDGLNWTPIGSTLFPLPKTLYVGMAVASSSRRKSATATFQNVMQVAVVEPPVRLIDVVKKEDLFG
jgi:hypothetical protein